MITATDAPVEQASARSFSRADARRNHDDVFAAAVAVFAERGLEATIPEIAARAGVGKATVYRSYPTKAALVDAVADAQLKWLEARVQSADAEADPFEALAALLGDIAQRLAQDRLFSHTLARTRAERAERADDATIPSILAAAQRQGRIRADATAQDIQVLVGGFSRILLDMGIHDPAVWRRYTTLVLLALRPDPEPEDH